MRAIVILAGLAVLAASSEAQAPPQQAFDSLSPGQQSVLGRAVTHWTTCEECGDVQLDSVRTFGIAAIPSLGRILRAGLLPARREVLTRYLERVYDRLVQQGIDDPEFEMTTPKAEYVQRYVGNATALARVRAARGLVAIGQSQFGLIGDQFALVELETVNDTTAFRFRPDVRQTIDEARRTLQERIP